MNDTPPVELDTPKKLVNFSLPVMIGLAILISLLIVAAAFLLYAGDPNRKYDIVRPDLKNQNEALNVESTNETALTAPASSRSAAEKLEFLEKEAELLKTMNQFDGEPINDSSVGLPAGETTTQ